MVERILQAALQDDGVVSPASEALLRHERAIRRLARDSPELTVDINRILDGGS
jgi:hypothetical protein